MEVQLTSLSPNGDLTIFSLKFLLLQNHNIYFGFKLTIGKYVLKFGDEMHTGLSMIIPSRYLKCSLS